MRASFSGPLDIASGVAKNAIDVASGAARPHIRDRRPFGIALIDQAPAMGQRCRTVCGSSSRHFMPCGSSLPPGQRNGAWHSGHGMIFHEQVGRAFALADVRGDLVQRRRAENHLERSRLTRFGGQGAGISAALMEWSNLSNSSRYPTSTLMLVVALAVLPRVKHRSQKRISVRGCCFCAA